MAALNLPNHSSCSYHAPLLLGGGHLQTIYPQLFRRTKPVFYQSKQIVTEDQDFLEVGWVKNGASRLVIITHGMEGSSQSHYVLGMVNAFTTAGWDVLCWNLRSCGTQPNRLPTWYHSGSINDLQRVFSHALFKKQYDEIALVGFSLGGNIVLNFLGNLGQEVSPLISGAVVFCPPCDLEATGHQLARFRNRIYQRSLLKHLRQKMLLKQKNFPEEFKGLNPDNISNLIEFDQKFTAPLHGYHDVKEYWQKCSPVRCLSEIAAPTLIVSSANDPFLTAECYPLAAAEHNPHLQLEIPESGGHMGFVSLTQTNYWSESRALDFLNCISQQRCQIAVAANDM